MAAGAIHCPTCGAAASADGGVKARVCGYCGTRLATIQCAACFGLLFVGSRFCPHCGAAAAARRPGGYEKIFCPRCRSPERKPLMEPTVLRNIELDECPGCAGVWIDHGTFRQICMSAQVQADVLELLGPRRGSTERGVRYLRCPLCDEQMARRNYARRSGVIVDFCNSHGLWFDHEELRRVVEFIRTGGLTDAHEAEADAVRADEERKRREKQLFGGDPWQDDPPDNELRIVAPATSALLRLLVKKLRGRR